MRHAPETAILSAVLMASTVSLAQIRPAPTPVQPRPTPTVPVRTTPTETPGDGIGVLPTPTAATPAMCKGIVFDLGPREEKVIAGPAPIGKVSASKLLNLGIGVLFPLGTAFRAGDVMEVRILTPRGLLYQKMEVPLPTADWGSGTSRRLAGYPHPVPVARMEATTFPSGAFQVVSAPPFAVGGTAITRGSLYGTWTVEAFLPAFPKPCRGTIEIVQ